MTTFNVVKTDNLNDWHTIATGFSSMIEAMQWTMHLVRREGDFYDFPEFDENGKVIEYNGSKNHAE